VTVPDPAGRFPEEWQAELAAKGEPSYRALQVFQWIHKRGELDPEKMTNLPIGLRTSLAEAGVAQTGHVLAAPRAADGTRKLLVGLADGTRVECVLIPMTRLDAGDADAAAADADVR